MDKVPQASFPSVKTAAASRAFQCFDPARTVNIPSQLRHDNRFVNWYVEDRDGKPTKVPINAQTGGRAMANESSTWSLYDTAVKFYLAHPDTLQGIGRMCDDADDLWGIDFDHCLDEQGKVRVDHLAAEWLPRLNSYTETTPSGTGVRVYVRSKHKPGKGGTRNSSKQAEMYRNSRFFTLTGVRWPQYSAHVETRDQEVAQLWAEIAPREKPAEPHPRTARPVASLADSEIIDRARSARNGAAFWALWNGDIGSHGSQSEADAALCAHLWFWCGDREQVRQLMSQSALGQRDKWQKRRDYQDSTLDHACRGEVYRPPIPGSRPNGQVKTESSPGGGAPDTLRAAIADQRPLVRLPGDNWLLSQTAAELGQHFAHELLFVRNRDVVALEGGEFRIVTSQAFRTLAERQVVCFRQRKGSNNTYSVDVTMTDSEAAGILQSGQFRELLRPVLRVNTCRLLILRPDGVIALLPEGYDSPSQTLTISGVSYQEDMSLDDAVAVINDLYGEFSFADGARSKAVAIAALVGLYCTHLIPDTALRPCHIVTKNAEGAGATTLVACAVVPVLGQLPTGSKPDNDDEMRKVLTTAVREGKSVLLLDNQKARLSSAPLEAFLSAPTWTDRLLGGNQSFTGSNLATVFVTANSCTVSPDMRRRSLFCELHLEEERAEERKFQRPLDLEPLLELRPRILAACCALVRHWEAKGQPPPSCSHSAFPRWAKVVGGIVETAGYACPLDTADVAAAADEDGDDMRILVDAMELNNRYDFSGIVELCRKNECFIRLVGGAETDKRSQSKLGWLLARYDKRRVKDRRFVIDGKGHKKRFWAQM